MPSPDTTLTRWFALGLLLLILALGLESGHFLLFAAWCLAGVAGFLALALCCLLGGAALAELWEWVAGRVCG